MRALRALQNCSTTGRPARLHMAMAWWFVWGWAGRTPCICSCIERWPQQRDRPVTTIRWRVTPSRLERSAEITLRDKLLQKKTSGVKLVMAAGWQL